MAGIGNYLCLKLVSNERRDGHNTDHLESSLWVIERGRDRRQQRKNIVRSTDATCDLPVNFTRWLGLALTAVR